MTKQEIVALIESAIAGQGSAVDVGGALPKILKGIVDLLPGEGPQALPVLEVTPFDGGDVTTEAELLSKFKLDGEAVSSIDDLLALSGKAFVVFVNNLSYFLYPGIINRVISPAQIQIYAGSDLVIVGIGAVIEIFISTVNWADCYAVFYEN